MYWLDCACAARAESASDEASCAAWPSCASRAAASRSSDDTVLCSLRA